MRKLLISILLAGAAATPALAQDHGDGRRDQEQSDRAQAREERQQAREQVRAERSNGDGSNGVQQAERPAPRFEMREQQAERAAPRVEMREQLVNSGERRGGFDRPRFERVERTAPQAVIEQSDAAPRQSFNRGDGAERSGFAGERSGWSRGGWSRGGDHDRQAGDLRQSDRPLPNVMQTRNPLIVSNTPREGTQPPLRAESRRRNVDWSTSWRHNGRYDWRNWRDRHRSWFHIGVYYDPFGWGYQPYQVGWRLWPSYYSSRYWLDDPWQYRLPYAPPGTVWIRYWDDAILVDRWTGEVVDVIHNFFW